MEKYNINLGFHYMKSRLQKFYLDKEYKEKKLRFEVIKIDKNNNQKNLEDLINIDKIYFSVNYPGLLIGTGTTIEYTPFNKEKKDNNFKTGLSFDYTTGLPYIPGSGIKGVIRDFFPQKIEDKNYSEKEKLKYQKQNEAKMELINQILESNYSFEEIEKIKESIFDGRDFREKENLEKENFLPIFKRDKFIEGRILVQDEKQILDKDYITPHKKILENPVPIQILKIVPETEIEILFQLNETKIFKSEGNDIIITKEQKKNLFTEILSLTGLGAKTNVGYGHFNVEKSAEIIKKVEQIKKKKEEEIIKKQEKEKLEAIKKQKENMSDFEKFVYEFKNEWNEQTKKGKVSEVEKFEGEEKKEIAKLFLSDLKNDKKPSKKTKDKIKKLEEIINS